MMSIHGNATDFCIKTCDRMFTVICDSVADFMHCLVSPDSYVPPIRDSSIPIRLDVNPRHSPRISSLAIVVFSPSGS